MAGPGFKVGEPAEKSPTVHYANWKEDMLLAKQLHVLNRSEKNFVHGIKIDQKVLYKRFQDKLHRSQLTEARMNGDKELERELRDSKFHGLNVDCTNTEKEFEFLDKLKFRSKKSTRRSSRQSSTSPKSTGSKKSTEKNMDNIIQKVFQVQTLPRVRSKSFTEGVTTETPVTAQERRTPLPQFTVRPATSGGERYDDVIVVLPDIFMTPSSNHKNKKAKTKQNNKLNNQLQVNFKNDRAITCSPHLLGNGFSPMSSSPSRSPSLSRRQSVSTQENKGSRRPSLFTKEEKVDVVQILLDKIKDDSEDYSSKVSKFCESLEDCVVDGGERSDYYNTRMKMAMKESECYKPAVVPGTPENEYKRHVGNLDVLNMTFKSLNFDFSRRDHSYAQSAAPDLHGTTVVYQSSEEDDDDSDVDDDY